MGKKEREERKIAEYVANRLMEKRKKELKVEKIVQEMEKKMRETGSITEVHAWLSRVERKHRSELRK